MQTRVFCSAADADMLLREERLVPEYVLPPATHSLRAVVVLLTVLFAVSWSGHRGVSLLAHVAPGLAKEVPRS